MPEAPLETMQIATEEEHGFEPFTFLGFDGETYHIGKTPLSFINEMRTFFSPEMELIKDVDVDLIARWMWTHMVSVEGQRHLTEADVLNLLFLADIPVYFSMIFKRACQAQMEANKFKDTISQLPNDIRRINKSIDATNRFMAAKATWEGKKNGADTQGVLVNEPSEEELKGNNKQGSGGTEKRVRKARVKHTNPIP